MADAAVAITTGLLTEDDLDDVLAVQRSAYVDELLEGKATFAAMLHACRTGCFALRSDGRLLAYFFTHPGSSQMLPPALDSDEHSAAGGAPEDLYYLHDLAVHADARKLGAGTRLLHCAVAAARAGGFDRLQVQWGQQAQGMVIGMVGVAGGQHRGRVGQARCGQHAHALGGVGQFEQFAAGEGQCRQVVHAIGLHPHQHWAGAGQPNAANQHGTGRIHRPNGRGVGKQGQGHGRLIQRF